MTTLKISKPEGKYSVQLDGIEIAHLIKDGGLKLAFPKYPLPPTAFIELLADVDLDLECVDVRTGTLR